MKTPSKITTAAALTLGLLFAGAASATEVNGEEYNTAQPTAITGQACTNDDTSISVVFPIALSETDLAADNAPQRADILSSFQSNFSASFSDVVGTISEEQFLSPTGFSAAVNAIQETAAGIESNQNVTVIYGNPQIMDITKGCTL